jgi:hypothetical protein
MADEATQTDAERKAEREAEALLGAVPAIFVDTWHIWTWKGHVRITFGEAMGAETDVYRYEDSRGKYKLVTIDDLREVRGFGIAQQTLFGVGAFLFSGAFWEMFRTLAEQPHFEFTPWMFGYLISMVAGGLLAAVGVYLFLIKQRILDKYFPKEGDEDEC